MVNDHEKKLEWTLKELFFSTTNINILTFIKRNFPSTVQAIKYFNSVSIKLLLILYKNI